MDGLGRLAAYRSGGDPGAAVNRRPIATRSQAGGISASRRFASYPANPPVTENRPGGVRGQALEFAIRRIRFAILRAVSRLS